MTNNILVTGGAGFLGSHLCAKLLGQGHRVTVVDDLCTGSMTNIGRLIQSEHFVFIQQDVAEPLVFKDIDQIYNLACPASPIHYQRMPLKTMKTSVFGAFNVLELARATGAKVLQASTSEVYGDAKVHPQPEKYWGNVNPAGIRSCYDEGKRAAEAIFFDFYRKYGVNIKISRIFNTYGPHMSIGDGRVVSNFIVQALRGEPITVYGSGKQTRSFCYVDDLVDGLVAFMESPDDCIGPINLGNPSETTMLELAELIIKLTQSDSDIIFKSLPQDDPVRRCPDITRARKKLSWEPCVQLEEGLARSICYFSTRLDVRVRARSNKLL